MVNEVNIRVYSCVFILIWVFWYVLIQDNTNTSNIEICNTNSKMNNDFELKFGI